MTSVNAPLVYGIDTSLTATGIASSDGWCDTIGAEKITLMPVAHKVTALDALARNIVSLISPRAALVIFEAHSAAVSYGGAGERAFLTYRVMSLLVKRGTPIAASPPAKIKQYATGNGQADKGAMIDACSRRLPAFDTGGNNNCVDAAWLAAMGRDWLGHPLTALPKAQRTVLHDKHKKKGTPAIDWPVSPIAA